MWTVIQIQDLVACVNAPIVAVQINPARSAAETLKIHNLVLYNRGAQSVYDQYPDSQLTNLNLHVAHIKKKVSS